VTYAKIRQQAARVREIPLVAVLQVLGARPDRYDPAKWHTDHGVISVTGAKFMNWRLGVGGGGAIDLVLHLQGGDFKMAVVWLAQRFPEAAETEGSVAPWPPRYGLRLPSADRTQFERVRRYLHRKRGVPSALFEPLVETGALYAEARGNAVFLLLDEAGLPVGAELRGTGAVRWRGLAPGSRKERGFFSVGDRDASMVILCESAIDALSCLALYPNAFCVSTSGATNHPRWLHGLLCPNRQVYCGFDADEPGENLATALIARFPAVQRLRPAAHDWNDQLRFQTVMQTAESPATLF
jgi:hypothetical protein